ncbi:MAG: ABC transporter permease [Bacteroidales bacterium]|nr:ABC transporter permease [Bacteroidales bacterium]
MIPVISWRNIWRNKIRSSVIIAAIAIGIFAGIFVWSFYRGMVNQRILTAIQTEASHIQLHHKDFPEDPDEEYYIPDAAGIANGIRTIEGVDAVSTRMLVTAMASSAETGSGVKLAGIDPEYERTVTNLFTKITEGSYFEGQGKTPVILGEGLAEKLSVSLGSRIVLTLQHIDGTITTALFRVTGIFRSSNANFDEMNVFVKMEDLRALTGIEDHAAHELAVILKDHEQLESIKVLLKEKYPGLDIKTWRELMPEVSVVETTMDLYMNIFIGIILIALVFGIVNIMLMAVLERVKEIGMLLAIGMNKFRVFRMIVMETVFLALTGGVTGIILGYLLTAFFSRKGIDLSVFAAAIDRIGYDSIVYPVIHVDIALKVTLMVLTAGIIASGYPAYKALRLKPSEALRIDL